MGKLDGTTSFKLVPILTLIALVLAPVSGLGWVLELLPEAQLEGPTIQLKDICRGELPTTVADIVLRDDIRPGETYNLERRTLLRRLSTMGRAGDIRCRGAERCRVSVGAPRSVAMDPGQALLERLEPWRPTDLPGAPTGWLELAGDLPSVLCEGDWRLELVDPGALRTGRNLVKARVDADGRTTRFTAAVICHRYGETARSRVAINKSDLLAAEDFSWQWEDLADLDPARLVGRSSLDDQVAAVDIAIDTPLRRSHKSQTPLVRQGESVELILGRGGVEISLRAVAREDGIQGQIVKVRNSLDGRLISGRVIGPNCVAWRN